MRKRIKWLITAAVLLVAAGAGCYNLLRTPAAEEGAGGAGPAAKGGVLHVNALVIRPQHLTDDIFTTSTLLPDEEVDLSFETSGKIVSIDFEEGTPVKKGQLLAKVNDKPLQAQLSKYKAQVKLAEDRVYRQSTLLEKDAVSQEAYEQARTELATLNADIELCEANIALTELRAPFDGIIGLRRVSEGAYASPTVVVAKLTRIAPLKIEFGVPERYASEIRPGAALQVQRTKADSPIGRWKAARNGRPFQRFEADRPDRSAYAGRGVCRPRASLPDRGAYLRVQPEDLYSKPNNGPESPFAVEFLRSRRS